MLEYKRDSEVSDLIRETLEKLGMSHIQISWEWSNRFTCRMGDAHAGERRVRFSRPLWPCASIEERRNTIIHEVCHITVAIRYGRNCGHDRRWKLEMMRAGAKPTRCHNVPIPSSMRRKSRRTVEASCACTASRKITPYREQQIQAGLKIICGKCRKDVKLETR